MFKRFWEKRKKKKFLKKQEEYLKEIKKKLSNTFRGVFLKYPERNPELCSLLSDVHHMLKARIDENNEIHLIIDGPTGIIYDARTTNYEWFLNEVFFF